MILRNLFALTVLFSLFLVGNRALRGRVSARARYLSGVLLSAVFLIPFRFSLISVQLPGWVTEHEIKSGVISMARRSYPYDTASSQFFIMHKDDPTLNGKYAAFGWVTSGMEFVDAICEETPVPDSNGTVRSTHQPKILSVRVVTE